ncbi:hypothetical protein [Saccharothrix xinjiangensis]|uniref:Uncharacterized protein n=1 Tax=Saccharothrix xinjiangensis TaxID=204798 RepID=A0ABV9YAD3_9PSEU
MSALTADIPFGPFEGVSIRAYAARSKQARLHSGRDCSSLSGVDAVEVSVPLTASSVKRMCSGCARSPRWARPTTSLGVFLETLMGVGLLHELSSYGPEDLADDLEGRNVAGAAELLRLGEYPEDEEDEAAWKAHEEARFVRDELLLPFWLGAAESLYRAHEVVARYPWLSDWARPRLAAKAAYAEELRAAFADMVVPGNLLDAAAAAQLSQPELPVDRVEFSVLGDPRRALTNLWKRWQAEASSRWTRLEEHTSAEWHVLDAAMGNKRKGRPEAEQALRELTGRWTAAARALSGESGTLPDRWLIATLPTPDKRHPRLAELVALLPRWHLGVLAVHTVAVDWRSRTVLLRAPDLVGRVLLDDRVLRCEQVDRPDEPAVALDEWNSEERAPDALQPGVLDDGPVADRRTISSDQAEALGETSAGHQLYLVQSSAGVEVVHLDAIAKRGDPAWRGVLLTGADDLPRSLVEPWLAEISSWDENSRFDPLGTQDGEHQLVRLSFGGPREIEADLRTLALARIAPDLRRINTEHGQSLRWSVWRALLSPHQLDLTPFRSPQEQGTRRRSGLGLPLAVLSHVQLYTTNYRPEYYRKGHSPYCSHARRQDSLDMGYDLLSVAELLVLKQPDWCGKCGGYAVRRLDDVQLRYYRSAHQLLEISEQLDRHREGDDVEDLRAELDEVANLRLGRGHDYGVDMQEWQEAVRTLRGRLDGRS